MTACVCSSLAFVSIIYAFHSQRTYFLDGGMNKWAGLPAENMAFRTVGLGHCNKSTIET